MRSFDSQADLAAEALTNAAEMLDEQALSQRIDEPIDAVLAKFLPQVEGWEPGRWLDAAGLFMRAACEQAFRPRRILTPSQAKDEAAAVLRDAYQGAYADGYDGAIVDASSGSEHGVALVLARLAEAVKLRQQQAYSRWVQLRWIQSHDWSARCEMAAILLARLSGVLPAELRGCRPEQFADHVHDLLTVHLSMERQLGAPTFQELSGLAGPR